MRKVVPACVLLLLAAGCGKPAIAPSAAPVQPAAADKSGEAADNMPNPAAPMLAYAYEEDFEAPARNLSAMEERHRAACAAALNDQCQVVNSDFSRLGGAVTAKLTIRATPAWLAGFRPRSIQDAESAGGKLIRSAVNSEDLTRDIVDTDAALTAKTTLRDRLQALLAARPGKLSDLLDLEKELSQVQGEIDATRSTLKVMRQRVATSTLTISYFSNGSSQGGGDAIAKAISGAGDVSAVTIAAMISLAAVIWPPALVIALGFLAFSLFRRRFPKAPPHQEPTDPNDAG